MLTIVYSAIAAFSLFLLIHSAAIKASSKTSSYLSLSVFVVFVSGRQLRNFNECLKLLSASKDQKQLIKIPPFVANATSLLTLCFYV